MKRNSKKLLITALIFMLTTLMVFAMPATVYAKTAEFFPTGVTVTTTDLQIEQADGDYEQKPVYEMEFWSNGANFSSYELSFRMPAFVQVEEVVLDEALSNMDNEVFTYYVEEDGRVNTAFSSPENVNGVRLFTVRFTVKDYGENYAQVEYISSRFVDIDFNTVQSSASLGYIRIGYPSFTMMGDVDSNGVVNLADLLVIQRSMVNPNFQLNEQQFAVADIDRNGEVNIYDCQYIQNYLVGRIDSLENIGGGVDMMYEISISILDQNGQYLFNSSHFAIKNERYGDFIGSIIANLSNNFKINKFVSMNSMVHGFIVSDVLVQDLAVSGSDVVTITLEVNYSGGGSIDKFVQYSASHTSYYEDGSRVELEWTFYTDYTVYGKMTSYSADGEEIGMNEGYGAWAFGEKYIEMYGPSDTFLFIDIGDGMLQYYGEKGEKPPMEDYEYPQIFPGLRFGLTVGSTANDLIAKMVGMKIKFTSNLGKDYELDIYEYMIDYNQVDFDVIGWQQVSITFEFDGNKYSHYVDCYIVEDMSGVEVVGHYVVEGVEDYMGMSYITLYADGRLMLEDYQVISVQFLKDDVIMIDMEGSPVLLQLGDTTAWFYVPGEDEPVIGTYVLSYTYSMDDTLDYIFKVYGEYKGAGNYIAEISIDSPYQKMTITTMVYLDIENSRLDHAAGCNMTFDEKGILSENHVYETVRKEPTCKESGYEAERCIHCGREQSYMYLPFGDHSYGDDDFCDNCGYDKAEFEKFRVESLVYMQARWDELCNRYGFEVKDSWQPSFDKYFGEVQNATREDTIWQARNDFENLMQSIEMSWGGGGEKPNENRPHGWNLVMGVPSIVTVGDSLENFVSNYINGNTLVLYFPDGHEEYMPVSADMISYGGSFDEVGVCYIYVNFDYNGMIGTHEIKISVNPDFSGAKAEYYSFNDTMISGWVSLTLYEELSFVDINGMVYSYSNYMDNVIRVYRDNYVMLIELDKDAHTARFYAPADGVIGTYTYREGDNNWIITVFEPCDADYNYPAVINIYYGDGMGNIKQEMVLTTTVFLDLGKNEITIFYLGSMFIIDEKNTLHRYGMEEVPEFDIDRYRDEVKDDIKVLWSEIDQGDFEVTQEQYDEYYSIMDRIYQVSEQWELKDLYQQAIELCNRIKGVREVMWTNHEGIPHRVVAGTTMEEFLSMLGGAKFIIHYSDGSEEVIGWDMFRFDTFSIDLGVEGEYEFSFSVFVETLGEDYNGITWLNVIANKAEGANLRGAYEFLPAEEGGQNMMEWTYIKLYDNGYALVMDDYYMDFYEYTMDGNIVKFEMYGMLILFEIKYDTEGGAVGISCYRAEECTVYTLDEGDWDMTVMVFNYGDVTVAYVIGREYNADGSIDGTYEICSNVELNGDRISGECIEGEYIITEGNVLVPVENDYNGEGGVVVEKPEVDYIEGGKY